MAENIEFKAKIDDFSHVYQSVAQLTNVDPEILLQKDIFYKTHIGRLKLRSICNTEHELIFYFRPNQKGPKCSKYIRIRIRHQSLVNRILSKIFGQLVIVKKKRNLFLQDNIRFHLDTVDQLGSFLEIEYVLSPKESHETAFNEVNCLIQKLKIQKNSLVDNSYAELLLSKIS